MWVYWRVGCWHEAASLQFRWPCCSWGQGFSPQPSPWTLSWPSRPRCVLGCWASPEPQRTPPARQSQRAGKQWAKCRLPWRRTLWAVQKPRKCTRRTKRAPRGCLHRQTNQRLVAETNIALILLFRTFFFHTDTICILHMRCIRDHLYKRKNKKKELQKMAALQEMSALPWQPVISHSVDLAQTHKHWCG